MNDKDIHPDNVELNKKEQSRDFTRYWTNERVKKSKLLAKKLANTNFEAVEKYDLRAEEKPENVVVVKPVQKKDTYVGLPNPEPPTIRLDLSGDNCEVFKLQDNTNYPK
jgi:hypothetical protein